jgi:glucosyl-3-phosphoglycerate synthase
MRPELLMSDFFQHGMISTLHRLVDRPILDRHESLPALGSVVLVLPCHYAEIGTAALNGIVRILDEAKFLSRIVISMNGIPDHLTKEVERFWSRLQKPHVVLWNDSPALLQQLANQGLRFDSGKGLNLWLAFGWIATNQSSGTILVHDCDIRNYNLDLTLALALPVAQLGYSFCKGYYSRVREELFGRVTRLFVIPLVRSLVRVLGHMPLLDFIDSFRYPLSGEYSMSFETAMNLPIESGWALEIGSLCELHRNLDPKTICQVDLAMPYDHKHQKLDPAQRGKGLLRTASEIAGSLLTHLAREGSSLDAKTLDSLVRTYETISTDFVRRYQHVAQLNALSFDLSRETGAAKAFTETLGNVCSDFLQGRKARSLPPWRLLLESDWRPGFSVIAE